MLARSSPPHLKLYKTNQFAVLLLVATIPFVFGAVHPVILGIYTVSLLFCSGGWLLLNYSSFSSGLLKSRWLFVFLALVTWIFLSTLPLPLPVLELLSPTRASALGAVNTLAFTDIESAPLNYNALSGLLIAIYLFAIALFALNLKVLFAVDRDSVFLRRVVCVVIGVGGLEALYGMLQVFNSHLGVLWLTHLPGGKGVAHGTIIYKNQYASFLNMCWPFAYGMSIFYFKKGSQEAGGGKRRNRSKFIDKINSYNLQGFLLLCGASFMMMTVLFTQSRGGAISMFAVLGLLFVFLPLSKKKKILLTSSLFVLILLYGSTVGFSSVFNRFLTMGDSGKTRVNLYVGSLPMLYDHLWTGIGLESYQLLSPVYLKGFPENTLYDRAHNEYLELCIELGLPVALLCFGALFTAILQRARLYFKQRENELPTNNFSRICSLTAFCAICGFLLHGTVDFGWRLPANILYVVTLLGIMSQMNSSPAVSGSV